MKKTNSFLYKTNIWNAKMIFFSGHHFSLAGSMPENRATVRNVPLYYGIQFNYQGALRLRIDEGPEFRVEGAYAFITHPGAFFEYGSIDNSPRHHNFICSYGERIQRYIESGLMELNPENPLIPVRNPERFLQNMHSIIALTSRVGPVPPRAVLLYEDLLLQLHESREKALKLTPCQMPYLERLIDEIRLNPQNDWNFEKEAEECHITPTHFRRLFKEATGLPPLQFLIQNRLQKAAGLLIHTSDPVSIIAEESGIDNPFYFSRLFKEKYQISPLEYRREFTGCSAGDKR